MFPDKRQYDKLVENFNQFVILCILKKRVNIILYDSFLYWVTCELKVFTTKKPDNPTVLLALPVISELSVLCVIRAFTSTLK